MVSTAGPFPGSGYPETRANPLVNWLQQQANCWYAIAGELWMAGDEFAAVGPALLGAFVEGIPIAADVASTLGGIGAGGKPRIGGSGKPLSHTVKHSSRKQALDGATSDSAKGQSPVHHPGKNGNPAHFHGVDSKGNLVPVHHDY